MTEFYWKLCYSEPVHVLSHCCCPEMETMEAIETHSGHVGDIGQLCGLGHGVGCSLTEGVARCFFVFLTVKFKQVPIMQVSSGG